MFQTIKPSILLTVSALLLAQPVKGISGEMANLDWWSLKPIMTPSVPELSPPDVARARTEIDHFIIAKLQEHGLQLSPEANRHTLIRRLHFDLTGLPPSPAEVVDFVGSQDPDAYTKMVDRLLDSPRYGERWARHWLDVAHYGDTHGYDKDKLRPNAWPYRDYVIRAFNEDKPYDRFIREQIAGDRLWPGTADGIVATGFIAAGPWDFIGHAEVPEEKYDGKVARHLDRDDMVTTTMNAFCSLTVQCAQCHHHKRDPVKMEDYYSLHSVFAALDRADRPYDDDPEVARRRQALNEKESSLQDALAKIEDEIRKAKTPELIALEKTVEELEGRVSATREVPGRQRSGRYGYHSQVAKEQGTVKWVQVDLGKAVRIDQIILFGADEYGFADFGFPHRFKVEVSGESDFSQGRVIANHTAEDFPRPGAAAAVFPVTESTVRYVRVTATSLWSRRNKGQPKSNDWIFALGELAVLSGKKLVPVEKVTSLDSIEALPRWGRADLIDGIYGKYPLDALTKSNQVIDLLKEAQDGIRKEIAEATKKRDAMLKSLIPAELYQERDASAKAKAELAKEKQALPKQKMVYAGTIHTGSGTFKGRGHAGGKPREIHVLARGDLRQPGEKAVPGTLPFVPTVDSRFKLPEGHHEGDRRVALANWLVHKDNPLTWRSIVNRIWLYHFGRGICDSPNDFGRMGQQPTHPELLDWLAVKFRDSEKRSIKDLHRLIVTSAVYRQSSAGNAAALRVDGSNRFLWRMNRRKLEAEAVRDTILEVSGKLNMDMYGPGFRDFVLEKPQHSPHYQYTKHDPDDATTHRRSVYRFIVRSQPQPWMNTLDCADPALHVDKRNETLTALQALALLNNKFVVRMAEHFAARMEKESPERSVQIRRAFQLAINRAPHDKELEALISFADRHGLAATCRVLFNMNEFAFVD